MPGPLSDRALSERPTRNTLSSGMLNSTIFISKIFPKKFGQKIGAGPPMEDFGNGTCAGPVLLHPGPPSCR